MPAQSNYNSLDLLVERGSDTPALHAKIVTARGEPQKLRAEPY